MHARSRATQFLLQVGANEALEEGADHRLMRRYLLGALDGPRDLDA